MTVQVVGSEFSGNDDKGAQIEMATMVHVANSVFAANGDHGFQIENDGKGKAGVVNSKSTDNGGDGFRIENMVSILFVNTAAIGNDDGMDLDGIAQVEVRNCVCESNEDEGIEGDNNGTVQIVGTTSNGNEGEGIDLDNVVRIIMANVTCSDNEANGFQAIAEDVATEQIVLLNCLFQANGESGIELGEEDGSIDAAVLNAVTATNNDQSGLNVVISGSLSKRGIVSQNNGAPDILP
jgi:hypothetical protein